MRIAAFIGAVFAAAALHAAAQQLDEIQGLEDSSRPQTRAFFKEESARARSTLDRIPGRAAMLDRIRVLSASTVEVTELAATNTTRIFYLRRAPNDAVPMLCVREKISAPERVLVDPARLSRGGSGAATIDWFVPSPDGKHVAYGVSDGGSEEAVLRVIAVDAASELPVEIDRARFNRELAWHPDGRSFFYSRIPEAGTGAKRFANIRIYRHVLGRDVSKDEIVFAPGVGGARDVPEFVRPSIYIPPDSRNAYAIARDGVRREIAVHVTELRDLAAARPRWRKVVGYEDEVLDITGSGDDLYVLSRLNAPRHKVLRLKGGGDFKGARVVIPEGDSIIQGVGIARDAIYLRTMVAGIDRLERVAVGLLGGVKTPEYVRTPFDTSITQLVANPHNPGVLLRIEGWIEPPAIVQVDTRGETQVTPLLPPPAAAADFDGMDEVRLYAPTEDGVKIPVTLIYRKSTTLTGEHPTLLTAYGSHGFSLTPVFDATRIAWLERGGILAVAHVRGGGEYGETWREAGRGAAKVNTINDLIAASEFLVKYGFTNPKRLAIMGASAGGIAAGGALVRRPDLYAAVILRVPVLDMLRYETVPDGPENVPEFGSISTPEGLEQLRAISALHHVKDGTAYPAVLLTAGVNDPRIPSWQPGKMAMRLQAASTSGKPVLLRIDSEAGHGIRSTRSSRDEELADIYSFLLWQMDDAAFQPPGLAVATPLAPEPVPVGVASPATSTAPPETTPAAPSAPAQEPPPSPPPPLQLPPSIFAPKPPASNAPQPESAPK